MTVSELIERLQKFTPDAQVKAVFQNDNPFYVSANPVDEVYEIKGHRQCEGVYFEI